MLECEHGQLARACKAALAEKDKEIAILNVKNQCSLANNLCSDHRDKQTDKPCLACIIEEKDTYNRKLLDENISYQNENAAQRAEIAAINKVAGDAMDGWLAEKRTVAALTEENTILHMSNDANASEVQRLKAENERLKKEIWDRESDSFGMNCAERAGEE